MVGSSWAVLLLLFLCGLPFLSPPGVGPSPHLICAAYYMGRGLKGVGYLYSSGCRESLILEISCPGS
jgi:hypothetical protein